MRIKNLPNILTMTRICLIPILLFFFWVDTVIGHYMTTIIFVCASITDYVDGYIARAWHAQTSFGRVLDPIADKLLVAATLMMLVYYHRAPVLPTIAILCREILVSGLREYLAEIKVPMPVSKIGKVKTACQMLAIVVLLLTDEVIHIPYISYIGSGMLWIAAFLTLWSGYAYLKEGLSNISYVQ